MNEIPKYTPEEYIKLSDKKETLDEKLYEQLKQYPDTELFRWLGVDKNDEKGKNYRNRLKQNFFQAVEDNDETFFESENFKLNYPKIEKKSESFFKDNISSLENFKKNIKVTEENETIKLFYIDKINEKINEFKLLFAIKQKNDELFSFYSKEIYGEPNKEFFDQARNEVLGEITSSKHNTIKKIASNFQEQLSYNLSNNEKFKITEFIFETDDLKQISQKTAEYVTFAQSGQPLLNTLEIFKTAAIKKLFDNELKNIGAVEEKTENSWKVSISDTGETFSVSQSKKEVIIPAGAIMNWKESKSLLNHEIGTHVQRGLKGEKSPIKLLRFGLANYERGEEGVATYTEQKVTGSKKLQRLDRYIAIGLAKGLAGEHKNFIEIYKFIKDYYLLKSLKNKDFETKNTTEQKQLIENALQESKEKAYEICVRVFRGVQNLNNKKGHCFTKDIVYLEGNVGIWKLIEKKKQENVSRKEIKKFIRTFYVGKWNPMDENQYYLLSKENII